MMPRNNTHWFEDFFDSTYQLTGILDKTGRILKANQAIINTVGLPQSNIIGIHLWEIPWTALSSQNREVLRQAFADAVQGAFVRKELVIRRGGRSKLIIDFSLKPVYDDNQQIRFIVIEGQDITAHKRTSEALFQSEARFKTIFEKIGIGIVIKSVDGKMLDANPAFQAMLGYTLEELKQRSYLDITHPLDKNVNQVLFDELIAGKRKNYSIEKRYVHKDGQAIWGYITTSLVFGTDGRAQFVIGMVENISLKKQIEGELGELQNRLMYGREMERLKIAQDLHDGPLQEIIAISYQLQALESSLTEAENLEHLQAIQNALHSLAKSVRVICGELRPPTLIPFGLQKTILSHIEEIKTIHPELDITPDLPDDARLIPEQQRIVLFRIYQEALQNILRHSQATQVWVRLKLNEEEAIMEVEDNGVGFELPRRWIQFARQGHLGLVGSMERAREAGGSLAVKSTSGQGTLIRATVPMVEVDNQTQNPGNESRP